MNIIWYLVAEKDGVQVVWSKEKKNWVPRGDRGTWDCWHSHASARSYQRRHKLGGIVHPQPWHAVAPAV